VQKSTQGKTQWQADMGTRCRENPMSLVLFVWWELQQGKLIMAYVCVSGNIAFCLKIDADVVALTMTIKHLTPNNGTFVCQVKTYLFHKSYPCIFTSFSRTACMDYCTGTVSSDLLGFRFISPYFFVSMPCASLS